MRAHLVRGLAIAILLGGCAAPAAAPSPSPSPSPTVVPLAVITITSPKSTDSVPAGDVVVTYTVTKVVLVPGPSAQKLEDYHVHVAMDMDTSQWIGKTLPVPAGSANPNPDRLMHTAALSATFPKVAAGQHTVTIWLAFSNHTSVIPSVSDSVTFTVK